MDAGTVQFNSIVRHGKRQAGRPKTLADKSSGEKSQREFNARERRVPYGRRRSRRSSRRERLTDRGPFTASALGPVPASGFGSSVLVSPPCSGRSYVQLSSS